MKTLLFLLALPLFGQTSIVTVPFTLPNSVIADVMVWSRGQLTSPPTVATLVSSMLATDTTFTLSTATGYTATDALANAGGAYLIDSEVIICTTLTGAVASSCARAQQQTTAAAHAGGAQVQQLKYASNSSLLKALLIPGLQGALSSLGAQSTYLQSLIAAQATAAANAANALNPGTIVK